METQTLISFLKKIFNKERVTTVGDNGTLYINQSDLFEEIERFDPIANKNALQNK